MRQHLWDGQGEPEGKEEPAAAVGVEDQSIAEGPQVHGESGVMTDRGGASGTREAGGAERPRVSGGSEGGRSQDRANISMNQDGARLTEARN